MSINTKITAMLCSLAGIAAFAAPANQGAATTPAAPAGRAPTGWANNSAYAQNAKSDSIKFGEESFYDSYIKGRIHVGLSATTSFAKETTAPAGTTYLGNIYHFKEDETTGIGFNVRLDLCDYVALSFANDAHLKLASWNKNIAASDGALEIDGTALQVLLQYPFRFEDGWSLTPYIGLGVSDIEAKWSYAPWWHYGWATPEDYRTYGNGSTDTRGSSRWMVLAEPDRAFTFSVGVSCQLLEHLDIDVFYRQVAVDDIDATFRYNRIHGPVAARGSYPAEYSTLGLALRYVF